MDSNHKKIMLRASVLPALHELPEACVIDNDYDPLLDRALELCEAALESSFMTARQDKQRQNTQARKKRMFRP